MLEKPVFIYKTCPSVLPWAKGLLFSPFSICEEWCYKRKLFVRNIILNSMFCRENLIVHACLDSQMVEEVCLLRFCVRVAEDYLS